MKKIDRGLFEKYVPEIIINPGISLLAEVEYAKETYKRAIELGKVYTDSNKYFEDYKRRTATNNYLKLHGYPMRRRRRKRS